MKIKGIAILKYFLYIIGTSFMVATMVLVPEIADAISPIYILVMGSFLAIDLATMLKKTHALPEGNFKELKKGRYIFTALITLGLFIFGAILKKKYEINILGTLTSLGITFMSIIAMFIGGLEGNKLLTYSEKGIEEEVLRKEIGE